MGSGLLFKKKKKKRAGRKGSVEMIPILVRVSLVIIYEQPKNAKSKHKP